jgi:hypothetical protein
MNMCTELYPCKSDSIAANLSRYASYVHMRERRLIIVLHCACFQVVSGCAYSIHLQCERSDV